MVGASAIAGTLFALAYGGACLVVVAALWGRHRSALGPRGHGSDPQPDLGAYKLAMLAGGPQLAITTAAARLHRDGLLLEGEAKHTLVAGGDLQDGADPLEREVYETVRDEPGISAEIMRRVVAGSEPVRELTSALTAAGLLVDEAARAKLVRVRLWAGALCLIGPAALLTTAVEGWTAGAATITAIAVLATTLAVTAGRPQVTGRGRAFIRRQRRGRPELRRSASPGDSHMALALYGGGALWASDPGTASTLGIPREGGGSSRSGLGGNGWGGAYWGGGDGGWGGGWGGSDSSGGSCGGGGGGGCGGGGS